MMEHWTTDTISPLRIRLKRALNTNAKLVETQETDEGKSLIGLKYIICLDSWQVISEGVENLYPGRTEESNIFAVSPGPYKKYKNAIHCASDALFLLLDETILRTVKSFTETSNFQLSLDELKTFVGLQYARGVYGRHHSVRFLWSQSFGVRFFNDTMSRDRFCEIKKHLRFDDKTNRARSRNNDPFVCIRAVFEAFTANCRRVYKPNYSVAVDEQLMPLKSRTRLRTYMPNKPDKYGIKFWMLVDNKTKYVYNMLPYLGAFEKQSRQGQSLAEDVVFRLAFELFDKGYNITMDNFFPVQEWPRC